MGPGRLVVAVGSRQGDDAAGPLVAELVRSAAVPGLDVVELSGDLTRLLDLLGGPRQVVVVDAVRGGEPGTVHRLDAVRDPLPAPPGDTSTHGLGIAGVLALARVLGRLPDRLPFYGIAGAHWGPGDEPSPAVRTAAARVAADLVAGGG
jgi:hydrogenase maturation protease